MKRGRKTKYPIELMERDFVENRLTFTELIKKYNVKKHILAYYSSAYKWVDKREKFSNQVIQKLRNKQANKLAKEEFNLIESLETLLKLKLRCESKVFEGEVKKFIDTGKCDNKELMYLLNKSKDPAGELVKIIELLKGNATERPELHVKEKDERYNRLKEYISNN